jgi:uncharacterized protein
MQLEWGESKRQKILRERGLDLADAHLVFVDQYVEILDDRRDYGEV